MKGHVFYWLCHSYQIASQFAIRKMPGHLLSTQNSDAKKGLRDGAGFFWLGALIASRLALESKGSA
jgi:hypothetical protein